MVTLFFKQSQLPSQDFFLGIVFLGLYSWYTFYLSWRNDVLMHLKLFFLSQQCVLDLIFSFLNIFHFRSIIDLHKAKFHFNWLHFSMESFILLLEFSKLADKLWPLYLSVMTFLVPQSIDLFFKLCNVLDLFL